MPETLPRYTEGEHRLHAAVRVVLSPGIWLVLVVQIGLVFSLQWRVPESAPPWLSALVIVLTVSALMLFFYLQAGAFYALTLDRKPLSVRETLRQGKAVFTAFLWLILKAGFLLTIILNMLIYVIMLVTGHDLKTILNVLSPFGFMLGVLAFVFVYWLPFVFVHREFHLLTSLSNALKIAWTRMARSSFLALLVLAPVFVSALLPAESRLWLDLLVSLVSGLMGWVAYLYCVQVLQENLAVVASAS